MEFGQRWVIETQLILQCLVNAGEVLQQTLETHEWECQLRTQENLSQEIQPALALQAVASLPHLALELQVKHRQIAT